MFLKASGIWLENMCVWIIVFNPQRAVSLLVWQWKLICYHQF
ncbi:hypothetical protein LINGRAHAP2_LOCUS11261 [Linum grandiflorum]